MSSRGNCCWVTGTCRREQPVSVSSSQHSQILYTLLSSTSKIQYVSVGTCVHLLSAPLLLGHGERPLAPERLVDGPRSLSRRRRRSFSRSHALSFSFLPRVSRLFALFCSRLTSPLSLIFSLDLLPINDDTDRKNIKVGSFRKEDHNRSPSRRRCENGLTTVNCVDVFFCPDPLSFCHSQVFMVTEFSDRGYF